jgi:transposase
MREENMEAEKWIGIDIHKKQITVCIIIQNGKKSIKQFERNETGLAEFEKEIDKETVIGIESTNWSWDLIKRLKEKAKDAIIFNTIDLKKLMDRFKKTDKEDAERMAIILQRFEKDELSTCQIRSDEDAEIRGLLSVREEMVSNKKSYKTKIIAMVEYWGIKASEKMFNNFEKNTNWIKEQKMPESIKNAVLQMYVMVENIKENIKALDKEIEALSRQRLGYTNIKELTGIGTTTGSYIITKVGNIERFKNSKKFVSYMGLAPRVSESDGKGTNGKITRKVDGAFLRVIVQAAWVRVRYDKDMKTFYDNVRTRRGKQKAIIAVARKMIVEVYFKLLNSKKIEA